MSLDSLVEATQSDELKFLFVGGKGGVGKTTSSSAIAYLLASSSSSSSSTSDNNNTKRILLVSTDPAHSLGDAWRMTFSNEPIKVLPNLDVMEIDPKDTMEAELTSWMEYAKEFGGDNDGNDENNNSNNFMTEKVRSFHSWLSGIPGIDEATALSSAMTHIESGKYDLIIFDTAPTGHTLKLLALPEILEQGISKLQSWQGTVWTYWEAFKGNSLFGNNNNNKVNVKEEMAKKLQSYKESIQKVATMLQDNTKTRFIVVCIAEYLSVSETRRLLQELKFHNVKTGHIIVNQLVVDDALSPKELTRLEQLAEVENLNLDTNLMKKTIHACRLTTARKEIQQKYLNVLKNFDETKEMMADGSDVSGGGGTVVVEVPLLAEEVTGSEAIERFANRLVTYEIDQVDTKMETNKTDNNETEFHDTKDSTASRKRQRTNTAPTSSTTSSTSAVLSSDADDNATTKTSVASGLSDNTMSKAMTILQDPEIKKMIEANPKVKGAVEDVIENPMNFLKYLSDPEVSPFLTKAMSKFKS